MKSIKCFLTSLLLLFSIVLSAQDFAPVVQNVNKAQHVSDDIQVRSQLERFLLAQPQLSLATYYLAYVDIQLSLVTPDVEKKTKYLAEAETYLNKLSELKDIDKSELFTLKGLRLYALMSLDPQTNGPKYSGEIVSAYATALAINPNNPRAIILSALFKNDMAKYLQQTYDSFSKDIEKASALFAAQDSMVLTPTWGKSWVDYALSKK